MGELAGVPRLQAEAALAVAGGAPRRTTSGGIRLQRNDDAWQLVTAPEVGRAAGCLRGARGGAPLAGRARGVGGRGLPPAVHPRRRRARPRRRLRLRDPLADASAAGGRARPARHARPARAVRDHLHLPRALRPDLAGRPSAALQRRRAAHCPDGAGCRSPMASERLQKLIARAGLASRRAGRGAHRRRPRPRQRQRSRSSAPRRTRRSTGSRSTAGRSDPPSRAIASRRPQAARDSSARPTTSAAAAPWCRWSMPATSGCGRPDGSTSSRRGS